MQVKRTFVDIKTEFNAKGGHKLGAGIKAARKQEIGRTVQKKVTLETILGRK